MAKVSGIGTDKIINVAEAIISAKGIRDTSLKDIAKAAGISKGTLYYHYATKESLIYDIAGRYFDKLSERFLKWFDGIGRKASSKDVLTVLFESIIYDLKSMGRLHLYLMQEAVTNEDIKNKFAVRYNEWRNMFAKMLVIIFGGTEESNMVNADIILALTEGYLIRLQVEDKEVDFRAIAESIAKMYEVS